MSLSGGERGLEVWIREKLLPGSLTRRCTFCVLLLVSFFMWRVKVYIFFSSVLDEAENAMRLKGHHLHYLEYLLQNKRMGARST